MRKIEYVNLMTGEVTDDQRTAVDWWLKDRDDVAVFVNGKQSSCYWTH